ncbi:MAG: hypothetical protein QHI38_13890 [Armatimonadota bacterium]|nr:hypothetical protein [Armatimonadota bacterium]
MLTQNTLPIRTSLRIRQGIHIADVNGESSGSFSLAITEDSKVTIGAVGLADGCPATVAVRFNAAPSLTNWDLLLVLRGIAQQPVLATIGLPAGTHTVHWAAYDEFMGTMAFPEGNLGLIFAAVDA